MTGVQDKMDSSQAQTRRDAPTIRWTGSATYGAIPVLRTHRPSTASGSRTCRGFPALDGVPLEAWYIPAAGSSNLIIANHPMGFSRSGIPTHLRAPGMRTGRRAATGFEVNLVPDYKILHDAGLQRAHLRPAQPRHEQRRERRRVHERNHRGPGRRRIDQVRSLPVSVIPRPSFTPSIE